MDKALDLYCGAGGASQGLAKAGFDVTGVDIAFQPNYLFNFIQKDVMKLDIEFLKSFDLIWASPPCQAYTALRTCGHQEREYPDLIDATRQMLKKSGKPYIIENVVGAPLFECVMLCGTMFKLQTQDGAQLIRHRIFETTFLVDQPICNHKSGSAIGVYGGGQNPHRKKIQSIGVYGNSGGSSSRDGLTFYGARAREYAMGISWMSPKELSQAIPPAYSYYLAEQFKKYGHEIIYRR